MLFRYVYERLTPPNGKPTFFTLVATQIVSGLWHGLYPGAAHSAGGGCIWQGPPQCRTLLGTPGTAAGAPAPVLPAYKHLGSGFHNPAARS